MKVHIIVDFMYLYYKYKFTIDSNRTKRLTADVEWPTPDGGKEVRSTDVSYIYYPLKEIEGFRRQFEKEGHQVTMSICFDALSLRKDDNADYKSGRTKKLSDMDFSQIGIIRQLLADAGYNVYWLTFQYGLFTNVSKECIEKIIISKSLYNNLHNVGIMEQFANVEVVTVDNDMQAFDYAEQNYNETNAVIASTSFADKHNMKEVINTPYGYEADDIIANLKKYENDFDFNVVYTIDADILANINDKIGVNRYKVGKGYSSISMNNFSAYCSQEYGCNIPYNGIMLFKCCAGDKSDHIAGISNFGAKAFDRLVNYLTDKGIKWEDLGTYEKTLEALNMCTQYLSNEQLKQATDSLSLVKPMILENMQAPVKLSTEETRRQSYTRLGMNSLIG